MPLTMIDQKLWENVHWEHELTCTLQAQLVLVCQASPQEQLVG